jgi:hypothetical protein
MLPLASYLPNPTTPSHTNRSPPDSSNREKIVTLTLDCKRAVRGRVGERAEHARRRPRLVRRAERAGSGELGVSSSVKDEGF